MPNDHRILIADDDRDFRLGLADLIGGLPGRFEIQQAESGAEALLYLRRQPFDLALLDMHMPGYTGLELVSFVRRETLGVPCIVLSGDATEAVRTMALHEGALAVFRKPPEPALLRAEISRALAIAAERDRSLN